MLETKSELNGNLEPVEQLDYISQRLNEAGGSLVTNLNAGADNANQRNSFHFFESASILLNGVLHGEEFLPELARLVVIHFGGLCAIQTDRAKRLDIAENGVRADLVKHIRMLLSPKTYADSQHTQCIPSGEDDFSSTLCNAAEITAALSEITGGNRSNVLLRPIIEAGRVHGRLLVLSDRTLDQTDREVLEEIARLCALTLARTSSYARTLAEKDDAIRSNTAKDTLLGILAHELRNPLTPIVKWAQVLREQRFGSANTQVQVGLRAIERNARILNRLVTDCIELSRNPDQTAPLIQSKIDLNQLVTEAVETMRHLLAHRGPFVVLRISKDPLPVCGDPVRIEQVVMNLLVNSVKYTNSNGYITVKTAMVGQDALIELHDTGRGIETDSLDEIFEPFRRGADHSSRGLGLGLAIARQIVEAHGGRIWAESDGPGRGSTFSVRLPLDANHEPAVENVRESGGPARVLIVEDSLDLLLLLKTELETLGHRVATALNGHAAIATAKEFRPDIIITDLDLPHMSGEELAQAIRKIPGLESIGIAALTGFDRRGDEKLTDLDAWITKPAEREELAAVISRVRAMRNAI